MISSIAWVRRGAAARIPKTEAALDEGIFPEPHTEDESAAVMASEAVATAAGKKKATTGKRRAGGDGVDEEDDEDSDGGVGIASLTTGNLMFHGSNKDDPNIVIGEDEELDSEVEDYEIGDTDLVILGARSDEQLSSLEAFVYEEPQDNLYPHHDIPLPVFPLCVEWLNFRPSGGGRGNFAAVGTFAPYIELWDLDILDALEPIAILGGAAAAAAEDDKFTSAAAEALVASAKQQSGDGGRRQREGKHAKRKKNQGSTPAGSPQGHTDAVMCLAWNPLQVHDPVLSSSFAFSQTDSFPLLPLHLPLHFALHFALPLTLHLALWLTCPVWSPLQPNVVASGSADSTIRLWDLDGDVGGSVAALTAHKDKVHSCLHLNTAVLPACIFGLRVHPSSLLPWLSFTGAGACVASDSAHHPALRELRPLCYRPRRVICSPQTAPHP